MGPLICASRCGVSGLCPSPVFHSFATNQRWWQCRRRSEGLPSGHGRRRVGFPASGCASVEIIVRGLESLREAEEMD